MTEYEIVEPGPDTDLAELATQLIGLADDPHDVTWQPRWGVFQVPAVLAARYAAAVIADEDAVLLAEATGEEATGEAVPAKRKPGRPRKQLPAPVTGEVI